jgi:hypothetical protein
LDERIPDYVTTMSNLSQKQHMSIALSLTSVDIDFLRLSHQSYTSGFATGIELETHGLQSTIFLLTVDQPDGKWHHPVYPCTFTL